jgi:aminopeptidase N
LNGGDLKEREVANCPYGARQIRPKKLNHELGIPMPLRNAIAMLASCVFMTVAAAASPPPTGRLPDTIRPTAYRLELSIDPNKARFGGHTEIDAVLAVPARSIFLHGRSLQVTRARVTVGGTTVLAHYTEVDDSGVARLDFAQELAAGPVTLKFDYSAAFRTGDEGLFRAKVGKRWYAWTQFEPIDARRMFPGFDEPGFKTPFTVTVTAPKSAKVFANAPEIGAKGSGEWVVHSFATTKPLPTYLVALGVGPFDVIETQVPANAVRAQPLPFRVIATQGQAIRMQYAAAQAPKLLTRLETYLNTAYPYEKLDFLASPIEGGAMENAGLIIFGDSLILLDSDAPLRQLRSFGEVSAHEMAHQWFGDLVTPTWWTDIWLNESFAEWMGKKVADQWRPDLGIAASELDDAFEAMDSDSLGRGRPIRQVISENNQIASAFDSITYQKGAQVLSMFESYLGPETFAKGISLYLSRYRYKNASAEDFFNSLGEAAGNPKLVAAMRTFTDQTGVPVVLIGETAQGVTLKQSRYRPLGVEPAGVQTWTIPMCVARSAARSCTLLETTTGALAPIGDSGPLMPNAGGDGYYRFSLDATGWDRLIAAGATLPGRDALAAADSLWADFAAGRGSFGRVIAAARTMSQNPERLVVTALAHRLKVLADSALTSEQMSGYRKTMQSIYGPRLAALGFDLRPGAYTNEPAPRQALRQALVPIVALEGRDPEIRARLAAAAAAYIGGDTQAIDPAFRGTALRVAVQDSGIPFMTQLKAVLVKSSDPLIRQEATTAIGSADTPVLAEAALGLALSPDMQPLETMGIVFNTAGHPGSRETALTFTDKNFKKVMDSFPGFARPQFVTLFNGHCASDDIAKADAYMQPKLHELGGGELELAQTKERIALCLALKNAKGAEIGAALGQ